MMPVELAFPEHRKKKKIFWDKGSDVVVSNYDTTNKFYQVAEII